MNCADELEQAALRLPTPPPSLPPRPFWENIGLFATKVAPAPLLLGTSIRNSAPSAGPYLLSSPILAEVTEISLDFKYVDRLPVLVFQYKCKYMCRGVPKNLKLYRWLNRPLGLSFNLYYVSNPPTMPLVDDSNTF